MDRRTFMKLLGGLASMPIVGRIAKPLKSETVQEGIAAVGNKGMELYEMVIAKVMKEGKKISVKTEDSNNQNLGLTVYFYLAAGLLIAVLIFLTITIYLLAKEVRWRKRHTKNESIIFPDAHLDVLDN